MEYGRIFPVVRQSGAIDTYVVAEPDKARAVAAQATGAATNSDRVEPIGRAC